jgi:hypothetical protein
MGEVLVERAGDAGTRTDADLLTLNAGMSGRAITERILELAEESGYRAALIDAPQGTVTAWPQFASTIRAAAAGLSRRGLASGDTAGVFVQDAASFAIALNAIRAAGAIVSCIRPDTSLADVAAQLNACGARVLITSASLAQTAAEAADRSRVRQVFAFGDAPGTTPFRSLLDLAKHGATEHGATEHGAARHGVPDLIRALGPTGLNRRDVVVAGPPCGDGHAYTSLVDLTLLTGATLVAAPVPLITAAMRVYNGTAAIVPRDTRVPGLPPERVFTVA